MNRHLRTTVHNVCGYSVDVSTIDLSIHGVPFVKGIETALFFNWADEEQFSEVVSTYGTWEEAKEAHKAYCNPSVLRHIVANFAHNHDQATKRALSNMVGSNPEWTKK